MEGITFRELDQDGNPIEPKQTQEVTTDEVVETVDEPTESVDELQSSDTEQSVEQSETDTVSEEEVIQELTQDSFSIDEEKVLSFLQEKYNVDKTSLEDVLRKDEIPEDVAKFLEYKKETGRNFNDFLNLQKDWSSIDDSSVLKEYYKETKPHLDDSEIDYLLGENFSFDEELDEDRDIKKKKISFKEELYKARNHFEGMKEKYKAPLESSEASVPEDYKAAYDFYNKYKEESMTEEQIQAERSKFFIEKTNALFGQEFKGFDFDLGGEKAILEVKDASKVKNVQSDISNFFDRHLDDKGFLRDPKEYHKAMYAANNADQIAKHFYEQGKADATKGLVKETKNIDMDVRSNVQTDAKGPKFRVLDQGSDFSMKIRKK